MHYWHGFCFGAILCTDHFSVGHPKRDAYRPCSFIAGVVYACRKAGGKLFKLGRGEGGRTGNGTAQEEEEAAQHLHAHDVAAAVHQTAHNVRPAEAT